ncbi:MAG TPA: glycine oxidase ThiO [Gemmataceae bacterium]
MKPVPSRSKTNPDYLIVGGGIIGCSLARELARTGAHVVLVERNAVGGEASSAAAGVLSPTFFEPTPHGSLIELCRHSAGIFEEWVKELRADGVDDVGYRRTGLLSIALDGAEAKRLRNTLAEDNYPGRRALWLTAQELRRQEPALAGHVQGAAYYPEDAHVDPARLMRQVARAAQHAGAQIHEDEPVRRLERREDRIVAVHTLQASYQPGTVILTTGAWTGLLGEQVGLSLPTRAVKGQLLLADCRVAPVRTPLHAGDALLVPWPDGRLLLGVTIDEAGFDTQVRLEGLRQILQRTIELVPAVADLPLHRAWAGLRPATPDELPYVGPVPSLKNLWVSAGHFRKGILLAPICARLLAQSLHDGTLVPELSPFNPGRQTSGAGS